MFEDHNGQQSSMRVYCFISLIVSILITFYGLSPLGNANETLPFTVMYLVGAFAPKAVQKFAEVKK